MYWKASNRTLQDNCLLAALPARCITQLPPFVLQDGDSNSRLETRLTRADLKMMDCCAKAVQRGAFHVQVILAEDRNRDRHPYELIIARMPATVFHGDRLKGRNASALFPRCDSGAPYSPLILRNPQRRVGKSGVVSLHTRPPRGSWASSASLSCYA